MKIGFAGRWSPLEKNAWSGTYFYAYQAIKKNFDVQYFHYKWPWYIREQLIFHKQFQKLHNRKVAVEFLQGYARWFSKQLEKELRIMKPDILFVPGAPQLIAYCKTSVPIIYMADATFQQLQGYYDSFSNLAPYNIQQGIELDRKAFDNAAHCMLASDWAKQSAVTDYRIHEKKITVQPLGANLDIIPAVSELKKEKNKICGCFSWA
ncbi:MAG: glycosyltransferase [Chitinophagaceae bacterium]|nr:glycosyltransferase [Chitinophagaceae bacterium]